MVKWDTKIDGEVEALDDLVSNDWCWKWPGWNWVANRLNAEYHNNRTPAACRLKYRRLYETNRRSYS